eukprot:TRINITY_DN19647_c0_g1_i1.p1 TRINITY_DN19647_c0_g1~~TRINITY_DN19647_c0_g1_i1.p1  ORF type:complete len:227 (-),score=-30.40 TRINITY_DN19647_c0_g1_i1:276-956(-)
MEKPKLDAADGRRASPQTMNIHSEKPLHDAVTARRRRRRHILWALAGIFALVLLALLILVIVAATVLKPKDPDISVNSVAVDHFHAKIDPALLSIDLNVTLRLGVLVRNPNHASFRFGNSTAEVFYRGNLVGDADIPAGKLPAGSSVDMNVTLVLIGGRNLLSDGRILKDALSGKIPLSTTTRVAGRVNVLGVFRHHAVSYSVCNLTVAVPAGSLVEQQCSHSLKL